VIAQGVEAGGHVRGTTPLLELVERVRGAVKVPVLAAGGIVEQEDVRQVLDAGAVAAVLGTRFLLSEESRAHPDYKQRCLQADCTVLTELFGFGWAEAPQRVVPNAATRRWLAADPRGPGWVRVANRLTAPLVLRVPEALQDRVLAFQRSSFPLLGPVMALDDGPRSLLDSGPLYAGASATRISDIRPAAEIVPNLTP
jgi:NAD(P)H-dependent flavin oxidoreductase YrpB (nitropropane dioxygenase family)